MKTEYENLYMTNDYIDVQILIQYVQCKSK